MFASREKISATSFSLSPRRFCRRLQPREAFGVRGACSRFRAWRVVESAGKPGRTPYASRHLVAVAPLCVLRASAFDFQMHRLVRDPMLESRRLKNLCDQRAALLIVAAPSNFYGPLVRNPFTFHTGTFHVQGHSVSNNF